MTVDATEATTATPGDARVMHGRHVRRLVPVVCALVLVGVHASGVRAATDPPAPILAKVNEHRQATWSCQADLGLERTPTSYTARRSPSVAYRRWVAGLWFTRRRACEKRLRSVPRGERALRAYIGDDWCLAELVDRETGGTWDPTVWNRQGSGAFGLAQALPASKYPLAGRPASMGGRSDPRAQLAWMRRYVVKRYGGSCAALSFHDRKGWY